MSYLTVDKQDSVAIITMDQPGESLNTLSESLLDEFRSVFADIAQDSSIKASVLISGKEDRFIAGADVKLLQNYEKEEDVRRFSEEGNKLLQELFESKKPVICAIHGDCLGGGTEVALACHYRIATEHPKTKFALPEMKLGLLPGGGGTQRLPRLVGIAKAFDIMLTGKNIFPRQAKRMGLVDELTHKHALKDVAIKQAKKFGEKGLPKRKSKLSFAEKLLENNPAGRAIVYSQAKKAVLGKTKGNYPAPLEIIESVKHGMKTSMDKALMQESKRFAKLAFTTESKSLVNLFLAMTDAKKIPNKDKIKPVKTMGMIGAGLMGSGIADVSAKGGINVLLKDQNVDNAAKGVQHIWKDWDKKVSKRIISSFERDQHLSKITPKGDYVGFEHVDLVIEAVFEDLNLKQQILADVEAKGKKETIFASNTSSLPISDIAAKAKRPENVIGMHYFSPVQKMPLLEIITTEKTADWVTATAYDVGVKQGKTVIVVGDGPGFYTTRILAPFMSEALTMLDEGVSVEQIDSTMKKFGFPVGPAALMDEVGIDVGAHVGDIMGAMFKKRGVETKNRAKTLLDAGYKGRKNNKGFYTYGGKKKQVNTEIYKTIGGTSRKKFPNDEIQQRLTLMMVNEAAYCLQEGILKSPTDGDLGAILGLGFPPFLGGPFRYLDSRGAADVLKKLEELEKQFGNRFTPAEIIREKAKKGEKFYN